MANLCLSILISLAGAETESQTIEYEKLFGRHASAQKEICKQFRENMNILEEHSDKMN